MYEMKEREKEREMIILSADKHARLVRTGEGREDVLNRQRLYQREEKVPLSQFTF